VPGLATDRLDVVPPRCTHAPLVDADDHTVRRTKRRPGAAAIALVAGLGLIGGCAKDATGTGEPDWSRPVNTGLTAESACARVIGRPPPTGDPSIDPKLVALTTTLCRPEAPTYTTWPIGLGWIDVNDFATSLCNSTATTHRAPTSWYSSTSAPSTQVDEFAAAVVEALRASGNPQC
jgi:hypothetical protein